MKKRCLKKDYFIVGFGIILYTILGMLTSGASESGLHEKAALKRQKVALQDNNIGHDVEELKHKLGVDSLVGADLSGADLRWNYLQEANLKKANLQGTDLTGANLRKANLQGSNLRGANLSEANLEETDLRGADLTGVQNLILRQIVVAVYDKETKFPEGVTFGDIPKYNEDRLRSTLGVKTLVGVEAQGMILRWGDFKGADMQWSALQRTDLTGANLSETNLSAANLRGTNLSEAYLQKADLKNANLEGANLMRANLQEADLTGASLKGANLSGADLHKAKLLAANLTGADLSGADLQSVDLRGADLREVKNITMKQLAQANVDGRTRLPEGMTFNQIKQRKAGLIPEE